jgi:hypothetical protein
VHRAAAQTVVEGQISQSPPVQFPVLPQSEGFVAAQTPFGSWVPLFTVRHVPLYPSWLQDLHFSSHLKSQQTPSEQNPVEHSPSPWQGCPLLYCEIPDRFIV